MENNLDKYFRDQLNDRKFEPREAYWLEAKAMLETTERRRKRKLFFWWFSSGIGLIALLALAWWGIGKEPAAKPIAQEKTGQTSLSNEQSPNKEDQNKRYTTATNTTNGPSPSGVISTAKTEVEPTASTKRTKPSSAKKYQKEANSNSTRSPFLPIPSTDQPPVHPPMTQAGQGVLPIVSEATIAFVPTTEQDLTSETPQGLLSPTPLPMLPAFVVGNFDKNDLNTKTQPLKIEVVQKHKLQYSLLAAGIFRPVIQPDEKMVLGVRAGMNFHLNISDNWQFSTGLTYQYRTGSFSASQSATQRNYRFGLELDTLLLRPTSLHYLSVPLLLGYAQGKHQWQLGFAVDYLSGVRGEIGSYQKQGEPPVKRFTPEKSGWVGTSGYRRWVPLAQFNYHYALSQRWTIGLSAYYSIGGILDGNYAAPFGSFLLKETDKLNLGLQLAYRIN